MTSHFLGVGAIVRHRERPDWGLGQIQSVVGDRITVNFENEGKVVLLGSVPLDLIDANTL
ncbi:MAG: DUF3553 domain-containing protein [Pseudomonadota bacterium]